MRRSPSGHGPERSGVNMPCPYGKKKTPATRIAVPGAVRRRYERSYGRRSGTAAASEALVVAVALSEVEQVKQIAEGRGVGRNIWIVFFHDGVGEIVAAAIGDGWQSPVVLDEL